MATVLLTTFQPESSPQTANHAMKQAIKTQAKARHCAIIWFADIVARKLFLKLGYSSIYQYAAMELGFSTSRTGDFLRLAKKLEELPQLKQELEDGKVGYTTAREIIKVAKPSTEKQWLEEAHKTTRDDLAKKVKHAKKKAEIQTKQNPDQGTLLAEPNASTPVAATRHHVHFEMSTEQFARYEALWEKLYKQGGIPVGSKKADILLEALASLTNGNVKETNSTVQIHIHKCPACEKASTTTSRGEVPLSKNELQRLECDANISKPNQPNKATIAPSVKRNVLSRDRHRCQSPGCRNTKFLEIHHIVPRKRGGSNNAENLITLCGGCHQLHHDKSHRSHTTTTAVPPI